MTGRYARYVLMKWAIIATEVLRLYIIRKEWGQQNNGLAMTCPNFFGNSWLYMDLMYWFYMGLPLFTA